jgi:predicted transcriptional regulator
MNHDGQILSMLLYSSQRRMVSVLSQVQAHLGQSEESILLALSRLEHRGLVYQQGPTVRLTLAGLAHAVSWKAQDAPVVRLGKRSRAGRSRAA